MYNTSITINRRPYDGTCKAYIDEGRYQPCGLSTAFPYLLRIRRETPTLSMIKS